MPLRLPDGVIPSFVPVDDVGVLRGDDGRFTDYRIEVLDAEEHRIGVLDGVQGGSLEWSAAASIKGSGSITVTDVGQRVNGAPIDWLNIRLRPVMLLEGYSAPELPLSVWLASAPTEQWTDLGRVWEIELLDKLSLLDQDVYANPAGQVTSYTARANAPNEADSNVVRLVRLQIQAIGEDHTHIAHEPTQLSSDITWETGTTRLKIINDLLDAGNFFSLYVDTFGNFQADKYIPPGQREVLYEGQGAFTRDDGVMGPEWSKDDDIYAIPNRVVCISVGDEETPALVSVAENHDESSRFSYENRFGRWITRVETDVEAVDQDALDGIAQRLLVSSTAKAATFEIQHLVLPRLTFNSIVRLVNPDAGINELCSVTNTTIPLDPMGLASSRLSEVIDPNAPAPDIDGEDFEDLTQDVIAEDVVAEVPT